MATEVKAYRANDGTLHETECAAATRDVELLVKQSPLSENEPYARKVVEWLTSNAAESIIEAIQQHARACSKDEPTAVESVAADDYAHPQHRHHASYREGWHEKPKARNPYHSGSPSFAAWRAGWTAHHKDGLPLPPVDWDDSVVRSNYNGR
jgi:hypothetical protein